MTGAAIEELSELSGDEDVVEDSDDAEDAISESNVAASLNEFSSLGPGLETVTDQINLLSNEDGTEITTRNNSILDQTLLKESILLFHIISFH